MTVGSLARAGILGVAIVGLGLMVVYGDLGDRQASSMRGEAPALCASFAPVVGDSVLSFDSVWAGVVRAVRRAREWVVELMMGRHAVEKEARARASRARSAADSVRAVRLRIENSNHAVYFVAGEWEPLDMNQEERRRLERDDSWMREVCGEITRFFAEPLREKGLGPDDVEVALVCVNTLRFIPQSTIGGRENTGMIFRHRGTRVVVDATIGVSKTGWSAHRAFDSDAPAGADVNEELASFLFDGLMEILGLDAQAEKAMLRKAASFGDGSGTEVPPAAGDAAGRGNLVRTAAARRMAARP